MFAWLTNAFGRDPKPKRDPLDFARDLHWIASSDNPWGVDVLDCRPVALCWASATNDPAVAASFGELRNSDGRQHLSTAPLPHRVEQRLMLDIPAPPPEGILFRASEMEHKWDIYHWSGWLFVARSWTGQLTYRARLECDGRFLLIDEITTLKPSPDYARKELHFLLRSHTQSQLMPAPLPVPDMPDPENPGEKALAANHLFSTFGRFGWFATVADITEKPVVEAAILKTWLEAHPMKKRVK